MPQGFDCIYLVNQRLGCHLRPQLTPPASMKEHRS
jgi:hypothetical protein